MAAYIVDPLADPRWDELLLRHPQASVFHTRGWLSALQQTYGFTPVVFTTSAPGGPLENALVFCEVKSWITGRRLVSLPFSDHCDPLVESATEQADILRHLREHPGWKRCKYIEIRPTSIEKDEGTAATDLQL